MRQKRARRGSPPDITSFRLLHRIDQPHHRRLPTVDFQPSHSLSLSPAPGIIVCYAEHSSRKICKHSARIGRGARIEEERDEATNNVELTLAGDSNFNGWKANMAGCKFCIFL